MKQIKSSIVAFAFCALSIEANAQTMTVADVEALPGETVAFTLDLTGGKADTYIAMQFDVQFPATGFMTTGDYSISPLWKNATSVVGSVDENGLATIPVSSSEAISAAEVDGLLTVDFTVGSDVALGNYDVTIKNLWLGYGTSSKDYVEDVTFTVKVTDRITLDEDCATAPRVRSGVNVLVKRTIKADEWSTICLPFAMKKTDAEAVFGDDVIVKSFTGYTAEIDETTLIPSAITINFSDYKMSNLKPLKAGTPYLIKTTKNISSFELDGVNITATTTDVTGNETNYELDGKFKGTLYKTKVPDKGLFISGNKFYYSTGNTNMKAFRGWFDLQAIYNEEVSVEAPVFFSFDSETTDINMVHGSGGMVNGSVYNLNGQRVVTPKKGLYIKNGKKVVVK